VSLRVSVGALAEADLTHQYRWYLENATVNVAEGFLAAFDATVSRLAKHPTLGRRRRFRSASLQGIRSFGLGRRFGVHLIFYRANDEVLEIERVLHGARDLPRRLLEPPGQ
jgi:toxin ParE1/3/4